MPNVTHGPDRILPSASRRAAIEAAVAAAAPLPRSAAALLGFMFPVSDTCSASQGTLRAEGFGKHVAQLLWALVQAGLLERQPGAGRKPDTYRLCLPEGGPT